MIIAPGKGMANTRGDGLLLLSSWGCRLSRGLADHERPSIIIELGIDHERSFNRIFALTDSSRSHKFGENIEDRSAPFHQLASRIMVIAVRKAANEIKDFSVPLPYFIDRHRFALPAVAVRLAAAWSGAIPPWHDELNRKLSLPVHPLCRRMWIAIAVLFDGKFLAKLRRPPESANAWLPL